VLVRTIIMMIRFFAKIGCAVAALLACLGFGAASANEPGAGFVGLQVQGINAAVSSALGLNDAKGVLVRDVAPGGPADLSGLRRGDLLLRLAGEEIDTFEKLLQVVNKTAPDQVIAASVLRAGKAVELKIKVGAWPQAWKIDRGATGHLPEAGLTMVALTPKMRDRFSVRWGSIGVLVTLVDESKAPGIGIKRGEVIQQVNQEDVWLPDHVINRYKQAKTAKRPHLLLLVEGPEGFRYVTLVIR
jgi:S1-C subfamily serine protease